MFAIDKKTPHYRSIIYFTLTNTGFGLTDQISDVFISAGANNNNNNFTRAPGPRTNLNCDLWNSNGSASTATAGTPGGGGIIQPFSTGGGTPNTANLNMFFNASANGNGGTNMVDPFLFPPTGGSGVMLNDLASCGGSSSTVKSYRAAKCEDYGSSKNVFNFSGPMGGDHMVTVANNQQQVFGSDCVGAGLTSLDNSLKPHPDVVHHHHHQQQQQCHQSLSRRHSDWTERMTGTASELLSDFTVGILDRQHSTNITTNTGSSSSTSTNTETSHDLIPYSQQTQRTVLSAANDDVNPFRSVNFQLMKALDQLCITSPTTLPNPTNGGSLNSPNNNSNNHNPVITSSCAIIPPPGFEEQRHVSDSLYGSLNDKELGPDMEAPVTSIDPWSNESSCSNSIFLPSPGRVSHSRVIADSDVSVKTSLLRRIFNGTTNATGTTTTTVELNSTHISSIWSATNAGNDDGQRMLSQLAATAAAANSDPHTSLFNDSLLPSSEGATVGVVGIDDDHVASITARCGAIGEGRRRQPSDSTGVVATSSSLPPASDVAQSLAIASITEVA